jgi:hypothetical protein
VSITVILNKRTQRELAIIGKAILDAGVEVNIPNDDGYLTKDTFKVLSLLGLGTDRGDFYKFFLVEG